MMSHDKFNDVTLGFQKIQNLERSQKNPMKLCVCVRQKLKQCVTGFVNRKKKEEKFLKKKVKRMTSRSMCLAQMADQSMQSFGDFPMC